MLAQHEVLGRRPPIDLRSPVGAAETCHIGTPQDFAHEEPQAKDPLLLSALAKAYASAG
jgi:hypothetical protein